jgi:hypothetical protein
VYVEGYIDYNCTYRNITRVIRKMKYLFPAPEMVSRDSLKRKGKEGGAYIPQMAKWC